MALELLDLAVKEATRANVDWMIRRHYLKKWPGVVRLTLMLLSRNEPVGVLVFAMPPRETETRYGGETWELARLWVDDAMPRNTESWFIAQAVAHVRRTSPTVRYLVSYADPSASHQGTIYRAANWIADSKTDSGRKTPRFDYQTVESDLLGQRMFSRKAHAGDVAVTRIPRVSKFRFVYPLRRADRKRLSA